MVRICHSASPDLLQYVKANLHDHESDNPSFNGKLYSLELDQEMVLELAMCLDPLFYKIVESIKDNLVFY